MKRKNVNAKIVRDSTTKVIAELFGKTPSYVSKVMADTKHIIYKGKNPMAIRQAYLEYKQEHKRVIKKLRQFRKAA